MKTVQGIRMNSSVKILLTCTAVALLLGWNLPGIQGDEGLNVPNPPFESDHLKNQSFETCVEKRVFSLFNVSIQPRPMDDSTRSITVTLAWIATEDILYMDCYSSIHFNGKKIGTSSGGANICPHTPDSRIGFDCPILKGKLYQIPPATYPIPVDFILKGDYKSKIFCKNGDGTIIICAKWKATFV